MDSGHAIRVKLNSSGIHKGACSIGLGVDDRQHRGIWSGPYTFDGCTLKSYFVFIAHIIAFNLFIFLYGLYESLMMPYGVIGQEKVNLTSVYNYLIAWITLPCTHLYTFLLYILSGQGCDRASEEYHCIKQAPWLQTPLLHIWSLCKNMLYIPLYKFLSGQLMWRCLGRIYITYKTNTLTTND